MKADLYIAVWVLYFASGRFLSIMDIASSFSVCLLGAIGFTSSLSDGEPEAQRRTFCFILNSL